MADPQSNAALPAHPLPEGAPRAGVVHVRHRHTDRYTVVGNHLAQHPRLSATAIGLGVHIQSLRDGACVTVKALTLRFREGETTIRRALNELEAAGYLQRRRVPLDGGRFATRTFSYDKPGCAAAGSDRRPRRAAVAPCPTSPPRTPAGASDEEREVPPVSPPPRRQPAPRMQSGQAAELLVRLRLADARLLLSARDVARLVPAVETWLARSATLPQIARTLTANLPPEPLPIHRPARFLEHRLRILLPPPLPAETQPAPAPPPLVTCEGCERAFRSHDPGAGCADCRSLAAPAAAAAAG